MVQKAVEDIAQHGARWQEKTSHPGQQPEWLVSRVFMMMDRIEMSALAPYRSRGQRTWGVPPFFLSIVHRSPSSPSGVRSCCR